MMTGTALPRLGRSTLSLACAVGVSLFVAPYSASPAHADEPEPKIMLVMDASGSMAGPADDGTAKIDAARSSLLSMLDSIPTDVEVGLRVFGATAEPQTLEACTDSQLTAPLASGDRGAIISAIQEYSPKGETPISYALQEAAADLGDSGQRSIILVSDGVATCAPDPCEVAGQIKQSGIDLKIDVVGLGVLADPAAKSQLECVAAAGGGQYYDANSQQELSDSLGQLAKKASMPYTPTGEPVSGTTTTTGAPTITAGVWLDQLDAPGSPNSAHFYRYQRTYPGSTVRVSAVMNGADGDTLEVRTAESGLSSTEYSTNSGTGITTASILIDPRSTDNDAKDFMGTVVDIAVERGASSATDDSPSPGALPVQIIVTEEPAVEQIGDLPIPQKDNSEDEVTGTFVDPGEAPGFSADQQRATGGTSLDSAQEVTSGTYQGGLAPGEIQIFKVPAQYGQFISAKLELADNGEALADLIQDGDVDARLEVFDGVLTKSQLVFLKDGGSSTGRANDNTLKAQTSEVRYRNRESSTDRLAYSDGYYYVVVSASADENNKTYVVPFTLEIGVHGEPAGAPEYPKGEHPIGPNVVNATQQQDDEPADAEQASAAEDDGVPTWVWATAAGVGGVALLAGAWALGRRQRTGPATGSEH